jgi:hypothetical protein
VVKSLSGTGLEPLTSQNDDVLLLRGEDNVVEIMDIQTGVSKEVRLNESVESCSVQRHQSTENWSSDTTPLDALKLAVSCPDHFKIISSSGAVLFSTSALNYQKNGGVSRFFKSGAESSSFIIQFEDSSLHFIGGEPGHLSLKWSREEGLSSIR